MDVSTVGRLFKLCDFSKSVAKGSYPVSPDLFVCQKKRLVPAAGEGYVR